MSVIKSDLFYMVKRFPNRRDDLKRIFRKNENFRSICEDYRICAEALKRWNESSSEEAPVRGKEYADLLRDLELEILQNLDAFE